jgi:NAD(P)-dependent dehydrogenase (short-subunit alcohol dehydrogenase family)
MPTKTVVISGTSSGIGLEVAIGAARGGWLAIATMRDTARDETLRDAAEAAGVAQRVEIRPMDVTDAGSVQTVVEEVVADFGRLDAVVNNAGAGHLGTLEHETIDDVHAVMDLNFYGVLRLTKAALPHLRVTHGRVVTVTSVGGIVGQPFNEAYCASKFAVEGFMEALHPVARSVGVTVVVIEPGAVGSQFVRNVKADPPALMASYGDYAPALEGYLRHVTSSFASPQTSADAATWIVDALDAEDPPLRIQTSDPARAFIGTKLADMDGRAVTGLTTGWLS